MLSPDSRLVAFDLLVPPPDMRLELGVFTTYTLDLEVMLVLPFQLLTASAKDVESLLEHPIGLLESLREAGEKIHVFVDQTGIGVPHSQRGLFSALEPSLHPVKAPNGGIFHPKLWILKFISEDGQRSTIRLAVLSRNLSLARTWDVALVSEGTPNAKSAVHVSTNLADLIKQLPAMCTTKPNSKLSQRIATLADEIGRTEFYPPEGFNHEPIHFHALGLSASQTLWKPFSQANRILAVAPFANATALNQIPTGSCQNNILVSRQPELDNIDPEYLNSWDKKLVLDTQAEGEPDDFVGNRLSGLHAKLLAWEYDHTVSWYVGSANLTHAAFSGSNVEIMAQVSAPLQKRNAGNSPHCIEQFMESGFSKLLKPYERVNNGPPPDGNNTELLEETRYAILNANLLIRCESSRNDWKWKITGNLKLPFKNVGVKFWPITIDKKSAQELKKLPLELRLTKTELTSLVAFHLHDRRHKEVEDMSFVLHLPAEGMPDDRLHHIMVNLISDWDKFRAYLRALLDGFDEWGDLDVRLQSENGFSLKDSWYAETLLEDLVRSVYRDPERLEPLRRLVKDIRNSKNGKEIIPDEFLKVWNAVIESVDGRLDT
ncbi:MAG: phospholipase D family protein [Gammaproteobacteria bacterium]|nr:phospholipase D family protein [Gammaproteobacteria bacterium]MDE0252743.1 phospholipase D family protein [Gammaproteobacteria bacterium]MDE0402241.1 phospholipase D family protein [Gammaproteobacteria bacterium]